MPCFSEFDGLKLTHINNANNSLESAKLLYGASSKKEIQKSLGYADFNGYLWVINASYYSMFYMARALLESSGIKIKKDESVHLVAFDALVYYFYLTGKPKKQSRVLVFWVLRNLNINKNF